MLEICEDYGHKFARKRLKNVFDMICLMQSKSSLSNLVRVDTFPSLFDKEAK